MSVPSMEELVETFFDTADRTGPHASDRVMMRIGLLAVLDRLKPVVAEGRTRVRYEDDSREGALQVDLGYATRIIDQIKVA